VRVSRRLCQVIARLRRRPGGAGDVVGHDLGQSHDLAQSHDEVVGYWTAQRRSAARPREQRRDP